ncbi:hypothetical protein LENED_002269 [Lentinula edodes]|uniref:DUF6533 domain-containing protein n=1 Tax=Lentinula edodes TaxID=5353 RepID=A0A1Q3E0P0_LENED|nr:hypothetical protein LENED_002269 [Lentinula edodes]
MRCVWDSEPWQQNEAEAWMIGNYATASASALWIVDHIETLPTELNSIWRKEFTGTSVLFLVNRYMFLLFIVMEGFQNFPGDGSDMQCHTVNIITTVFQSLALVTTNALFALRVYAIYNKNKVILGVTFVFIISRFVFDILSTVLALGNIGAPLDGEIFIEEEEEGEEGEMEMENIKEDHERFYEAQRP